MSSAAPPRYAIARHRPPTGTGPSSRIATPRMKIIIRRLPPGLGEAEFYACLGEQWRTGQEKVDWASYKPGSISKELNRDFLSCLRLLISVNSPAKPSRPARAYLHLTKQEYLSELTELVHDTQFTDAKGSGSDPVLLGPPTVEFAPYGRIPNGRMRKDARQGTIDQDPEFIDFLESLTNPTTKPTATESGSDSEVKKIEVTITPLIQYLRDKKANKSKETTPPVKGGKHSRHDSKDSKTSQGSDKKVSQKESRDSTSPVEKRSASAIKVEKAARDAVKLLNKQAVSSNKTSGTLPVVAPSSAPASSQTQPVPTATADRKRERGPVSAAARIQRDLGIGGSPAGRRRRDAPTVAGTPATTVTTAKQVPIPPSPVASNSTPSPQTVIAPILATRPSQSNTPITTPNPTVFHAPTGPAASRTPTKPQNNNLPKAPQAPTPPTTRPPQAPSTATQAFLKHANPSQGITEPLLEQAFAHFGPIAKVEIDKKKGFAYIDFAEPEGLQKAIAASPVKVAQGQVVVLERKTGQTLQARNMRGGPAMSPGRGGGVPRGGRGGARGRGGMPRAQISGVVQKPAVASPATADVTTAAGAAAVEPSAVTTSTKDVVGPAAE